MRKKRSIVRSRAVTTAAVFLIGAAVIKILSVSGLGEKTQRYMAGLGKNGALLRYAVAQETQVVADGDIVSEIVAGLCSETAITPAEVAELSSEDEAEEIPKAPEIPTWKYIPGGKTEEKTLPIKEININPTTPKGYVVLNNIYVKNDSTKGIDLKYLLGAKLPFSLTGKGPHVLIVHTHGSESYFPQGADSYTPTDVERTEDTRYNVVRVGDELASTLEKAGIKTVHDRSIYDSPSYNGAYTRTLAAIGAHIKKNPSIKVVLDIHRDSMTTDEGIKYKTAATVNGEKVAQMMIVMSTGESGLPHPNWAENLKLAIKLQNAVSKKYPGLMRPVNLRKERFNMHATTGSMLIEVGTSANSLGEALGAIRILGSELAAILKTAK